MKLKRIISITLGLFVFLSILYWGVSEINQNANNNASSTDLQASDTSRPTLSKRVEGLYFHGTNRCYTCNLMEGYILDVLKESFDKEVKEGLITFESINVEEPSKSHYIQDYQLNSISFFLSIKKEGKEVKFTNVDQIWKLAGNESNFKNYIKQEIKKHLEL
ncbi:MAG: hypothetical protein A2381_11510 [Bdellovibrionales bacterium RIFOXYB1_FULL_37_110]|nr:MAG: hypothetical protein A2417_11815 [Bdellovibrionales bacterium RIFOXYC1_FULL_37_79]OFZ57318.1 MAG: hypothetical protein A2381_11510 [Bdellovibrionales bacterium RIFOXYB1_FULL_37_110]OFZ62214.1 MAG: hypothetical protein A2577_14060 [Bdellovibrionales bacterium RIFOXYD1_FULL_36_51]